MKQLFCLILFLFSFSVSSTFAQGAMHESFQKEKELTLAFKNFDITPFMGDKTNFIFDTLERETSTAAELNLLMKTWIPVKKNEVIRKASETNNGYVQTFGIYKGDDALYYIRFTLNPLTGKLEEVMVEKNN